MVISGTNPHNREMAIRRRMASIFNKREDDFPSLKEYNDYLEEVEEMTFNLIEGMDVPTIEAKIAKYQEENAEQIMINRAKKAEEFAAALAASKGLPPQTDPDGQNHARKQDHYQVSIRSNVETARALNSQAGLSVGTQGQYAPAIAGGQPRPTGMAPQPVPLGTGLDIHGYDDEEMMKLRAERGGRAGGWSIELSKKRAIEEAFGSLWI